MSVRTFTTSLFYFVLMQCASAQTSILGTWKSIDDKTGEAKSIVEIYVRGAKIYGKIVKIFPRKGVTYPICTKCPKNDPRFNKKILGMDIIKELTPDGDEFEGGDILDPEVGKVYNCKLWIEGNQLKVRGYLGPFYRTQTWEKATP
ncbi:MAG: DUF2147 domain-containing protein [Cyclobacteriaceae bacterium]